MFTKEETKKYEAMSNNAKERAHNLFGMKVFCESLNLILKSIKWF